MKTALTVAYIALLTTASVALGADSLDRQAERFVTLALSLGKERPAEIDGYFGPARLDARAATTASANDATAATATAHANVNDATAATATARTNVNGATAATATARTNANDATAAPTTARANANDTTTATATARTNANDASIAAAAAATTLATLRAEARKLRADIAASSDKSPRRAKLQSQVDALIGLLDVLAKPGAQGFDAEALSVYGMTAPPPPDSAKLARAQQALAKLLPGSANLATRVASFRNQFVIPPDKRKAVFERALSECRKRTRSRWALPESERLHIEWTRDVDAAWHRYEGHYRSTLRLNPAAVAYLTSAIDVACHEGYPGHHAQFVVMEARAGAGKLPVEDTVVLLRSPISMLREGAANYGVQLAFPPAERLAFERDVLFPLAGFDPALAKQYAEVNRLVDELSSNVAAIVRDYRDKRLSLEAASRALEDAALIASPAPLLRFVDQLGPYVLGYTAARDKVDLYIETERRANGAHRWSTLRAVLGYSEIALLR